jgi:membrane-associated protein
MNPVAWLVDFILHVDVHLAQIVATFGAGAYAVLFLVVFAETGLVVTPFLPGDSLLFAAGAFAARGLFSAPALWVLLVVAAFAGDNTNYWIGRTLGLRMLKNQDSRVLKRAYLDKTQAFYDRHGGQTLILARFVPIVRTFAPFMAGVGSMRYLRFLAFSLASALLWVTIFVGLGLTFGNLPAVQENFSLAIVGIVLVSVSPGLYHWVKSRLAARGERCER